MDIDRRPFMNNQVTIRMTGDLLRRVDRLAEDAIQTRGAWVRSAVVDRVRSEERLLESRTQRATP